MSFPDTFTFARPTAAPYVDAAGVTRTAAIDAPRFDFGARGRARGLLVEAGAQLGQADRVRLRTRDWSASATWTILHDWHDGTRRRAEAHYTRGPEAMIDGCLSAAGHHRRVAACAGYLPNYGGWVWAWGQRWDLPGVIGTSTIVVATAAGRPILAR